MTVNVQFVKMASSETMTACVSKKLKKLTEKYDWIINADVYFKPGKRLLRMKGIIFSTKFGAT